MNGVREGRHQCSMNREPTWGIGTSDTAQRRPPELSTT
jgi:hypothetical protein